MAYAPVYPHDPIEPIADDVFMARGSIRFNALLRITRNMGILRHGDELTTNLMGVCRDTPTA